MDNRFQDYDYEERLEITWGMCDLSLPEAREALQQCDREILRAVDAIRAALHDRNYDHLDFLSSQLSVAASKAQAAAHQIESLMSLLDLPQPN